MWDVGLSFTHPLSIPLTSQGHGEAEINPRCLWVRGEVTPWTGYQSITWLTQRRITIHTHVHINLRQFKVAS